MNVCLVPVGGSNQIEIDVKILGNPPSEETNISDFIRLACACSTLFPV